MHVLGFFLLVIFATVIYFSVNVQCDWIFMLLSLGMRQYQTSMYATILFWIKIVTSDLDSKLVLLLPLHITNVFVLNNAIISLLEVKMGKGGSNNQREKDKDKRRLDLKIQPYIIPFTPTGWEAFIQAAGWPSAASQSNGSSLNGCGTWTNQILSL